MSDEARSARRVPSILAASLTAGLVSALLYLSVLLSFVFLLPVQFAYERRGRSCGMIAAGCALFAVTAGQLARVAGLGGSDALAALVPGDYLSLVLPPFILLGGLVFVNAPIMSGLHEVYRSLLAVALCSLVALPGIIALGADAAFSQHLEASIGEALKPLVAQMGEGYEASAVKAALDPAALVAQAKTVALSGFAAMLYALIGLNRWLGTRLAALGRPVVSVPRLAEYRLPFTLVWPFLAAWAGVLAARYFSAPLPLAALAWNSALVLSLSYAVQGIGIASHLMNRWNLPRSLRIALTAFMVLMFATPPFGVVLAAVFPLLGVTEVWIPYRNPKGVGA